MFLQYIYIVVCFGFAFCIDLFKKFYSGDMALCCGKSAVFGVRWVFWVRRLVLL